MAETRYKVYTKTGDKGTSSLYNGERRGKTDAVFHALGDIDELNSAIGVAREFAEGMDIQLSEQLEETQSRLLDVGSAVATPVDKSTDTKLQRTAFSATHTEQLERWIDGMDAQLAPLKNFILPSGGKAASFLHMSRSICRRAERSTVPLVQTGSTDAAVGTYLNRLSDYLFTAARYAAKIEGKAEVVYKKQS